MIDRLADDHANARRLADGLASAAPAGSVPMERVQTNMALFDAGSCGLDGDTVIGALRNEGVLAGLIAPDVLRFVTHKDLDASDIDRAVRAFGSSLKTLG
jgi:threonine aldolase